MDILKDYTDSVAYVEGFSNTSMRKNYGSTRRDPNFYLLRTAYFLKLLGDPQRGLKVIHITGTAGKGSVSAGVHEALVRAGRAVGLFTSPYVTTAIEEIKVGHRYISPDAFVRIVRLLKPIIAKAAKGPYGCPAAFEIFLAIAFLYFKEQKCEWAVLEVGLGGRYDATNIVSDPVVTAITNIDYDHTEILGKTLAEISFDKAGIIKKGSQFFTSEQRPLLQRFFRKICEEKGAAFHAIPKQIDHRAYNRELVTEICRAAGLSEAAARTGLEHAKLPARFEIVEERPTIVIDGAHNRSKIRSTMDNVSRLDYRKLVVVIGISNTKKDTRAVIGPASRAADVIIVTPFGRGDRTSVHPRAILPFVRRYKKRSARTEVAADIKDALRRARAAASKGDCILITGSFFLAGLMRTEWYPEKEILKKGTSF